jgi:hypothetical protein
MKLGTYIMPLESVTTAWFVYVLYVGLSFYLLGNGSIDTFPRQRMHTQQ